jgi:hypothetical protein
MNKLILSLFMFLLVSFTVAGQATVKDTAVKAGTAIKPQIIDNSLKGQYQSLMYRSKSYYGAKLIVPARLTSFYNSVADSIRKERAGSKAAQNKINAQAQTIDTLNNQIKAKESALESSNSKSDDISFLGISFSKSSYNTIVWSIIGVLALGLIFVTGRSAKNIQEAKYRSELYEEISKEYQTYKTKSNEKEKKLARELQDERNKLDDYKNKGLS